jgi:hypothetical protein
MNDRACGSRAAFLSLALCISAALAGCGGGGDSSSASANPVAQQPASPGAPTPDPTTPSPAPAPGPTQNSAPTISGVTISSVSADAAYSFKPTALDADSDPLTFQIENKPAWAAFSTVTGELSGTPTPAHAGTYANIAISVSDGQASASLTAFSITVVNSVIDGDTLYWTAPTATVDGGPLLDLKGFTIAYGPSKTMLHRSVRIDNPSVNRYALENLASGTHYFAVSAYTASGAQSPWSNIVSKVVP